MSAAERDLDFHCSVGFEDGLRATVAWFSDRFARRDSPAATSLDTT